jgi:hypothetical protein
MSRRSRGGLPGFDLSVTPITRASSAGAFGYRCVAGPQGLISAPLAVEDVFEPLRDGCRF